MRDLDIISTPNAVHQTMSRQSSVTSLTGLDMSEPDEGMSGPISTLMDLLKGGNVRSGSLLNLIIVSLLLFATISDFAFRSSAKTGYNSKLPGKGLNPPYSAHRDLFDAQKTKSNRQEKGLLGSAMIQSVTEVLSPILPFIGGVDLSRYENWKSWFTLWHNPHDKPTTIEQVTSIPRGGQLNKNRSKDTGKKRRTFQPKLTLSVSESFLSIEDIDEMTLQELALLFSYATVSGDESMDVKTFLEQKHPADTNIKRLAKAIGAIERAVSQSMGEGVSPAITFHREGSSSEGPLSEINGYGDVDALKFCAAMRIFAEWRVLKVPPGHKGYLVGMNLGHKDVVQNVLKVETAVHKWIKERSEEESQKRAATFCSEGNCSDLMLQPRSPTLRQLLQYEIEMNVHPTKNLPRLKEKSAAMGLLWTFRQLQYQTAIFKNVIKVPEKFPTVIGAVAAAYTEVFGNLHGWTVQQIFNYSFKAAPDADLIFRYMNRYKLNQLKERTEAESDRDMDMDSSSDHVFIFSAQEPFNSQETPELGEKIKIKGHRHQQGKDGNPIQNFFSNLGSEYEKIFSHIESEIDKFGHHVGDEWDKFGHHVGTEWDKTVCNLGNLFMKDNQKNCKIAVDNNRIRDDNMKQKSKESKPFVNMIGINGEKLEAYISKEMAIDARMNILNYLEAVVPLMNDLTDLFNEMNMNDPTKV